jgi:hypothetical protein
LARRTNDRLDEAVRRHPGRFSPYGEPACPGHGRPAQAVGDPVKAGLRYFEKLRLSCRR